MKKTKKVLSVLLIVLMLSSVMITQVSAHGSRGILDNGLGGIYIDIYSSIYEDSRWWAYGAPYGAGGCTWFVGARVMELTGKGSYNTQTGGTWYNSYGSSLGFSKGQTPKAGSVICWSGHVAFLEKIEGNTAYISEGGHTSYPGNDYCRIFTCNVSSISSLNSGFIGYVYTGAKPVTAHSLDADVIVDGTVYMSGYTGFTFDVHIDGVTVASNVKDYYNGSVTAGAAWSLVNIKNPSEYVVTGSLDVYGNFAGVLNQDTLVKPNFIKPTLKSSKYYNGSKYEFYSATTSWDSANLFAKGKGGHLVTINSSAENEFLKSNNTVGACWLGGKKLSYVWGDDWGWINGEPFSFTNWKENQPDNNKTTCVSGEKYLMMYDTGKWNDCPCYWSTVKGFVVEYDHTHSYTSKTTTSTYLKSSATCTSAAVYYYKCATCDAKGTTTYTSGTALGHKSVVIPAVKATCIKTGLTEGTKCSVCGVITKAQTATPITDHTDNNKDGLCDVCGTKVSFECEHSYVNVVVRASYNKDGFITKACQYCGDIKSKTTIAGIGAVAYNNYCEYTGEEIKPEIYCVLDNDGGVIPEKYYTVTYSDNVEIGTGKVIIKFKGNYTGTITEEFTIIHTEHQYTKTTKKATLSANGKITKSCLLCDNVISATIYSPKTFTIAAQTYTGKATKPAVTITDSKGKVIDAKYYTVAYANNTKMGTATATIVFKGNYSGTKSITYKIVPGQVKDLNQTAVTATTFKLTWTKVTGAKYYMVEWSKDGKTWKTLSTVSTNSIIAKPFTAGVKYQFRVTALDSTKKYVGKASAILKTQTLCSTPTFTLTSTQSNTATVTITKVTGASKYIIFKSTDNKNWTRVDKTDKNTYNITGLTGGKKIYVKVQAVNSYSLKSAYSSVASVTVKR